MSKEIEGEKQDQKKSEATRGGSRPPGLKGNQNANSPWSVTATEEDEV